MLYEVEITKTSKAKIKVEALSQRAAESLAKTFATNSKDCVFDEPDITVQAVKMPNEYYVETTVNGKVREKTTFSSIADARMYIIEQCESLERSFSKTDTAYRLYVSKNKRLIDFSQFGKDEVVSWEIISRLDVPDESTDTANKEKHEKKVPRRPELSEEENAFIQGVEFALDYGFPISEKDMLLYKRLTECKN